MLFFCPAVTKCHNTLGIGSKDWKRKQQYYCIGAVL